MRSLFRILLLLVGSALGLLAFAFSPWSKSPFPFGSALACSFFLASAIALWAALRLHHRADVRLIIYATVSGLISGWLGLAAGVLVGVFASDKNLSPLVGFFVWGPVGFILGAVAGILLGWFRAPRGRRSD